MQEATELTEVLNNVDTVFASGNPEAMVQLLKTMRHSLSLVGRVPEFEGGQQRVKVLHFLFSTCQIRLIEKKMFFRRNLTCFIRCKELESRFRATIEPQLSDALSQGDGRFWELLQSFASCAWKALKTEALP